MSGVVRVLIADDDESGREALACVLRVASPVPVAVAEAADGGAALGLAADMRPHVVILDLQMPVLDGCQTAQSIRKYSLGDHPPLLVAMSGSSAMLEFAVAGDLFDHALLKPVPVDDLLSLVFDPADRPS